MYMRRNILLLLIRRKYIEEDVMTQIDVIDSSSIYNESRFFSHFLYTLCWIAIKGTIND